MSDEIILTPDEMTQIQRLFSDPLSFPNSFKTWLTSWLEANPPVIPISQVYGFTQFTANAATPILTSGATTSASYTDLSDAVGPQITNLSDGHYIIWFGGAAQSPVAGRSANISVSVNAGAASDNDSCYTHTTNFVSISRSTTVTLSNGNKNTISVKYRSGLAGDSTSYNYRWLTALKFSNL